ncbi:hypothetical protein [Alloyangia pacifica]|uniref:Metallo-beta-lactamase domain-containing protein n=1 Tax=Alloyangia pacifica TaxID=311180 RepID=A0A1I6UUE6_9RHOB|nr:hypothetical protein [Alloyangia pacifica]SDI53663.1 hypothetical protein SAMN04488245_11813 [Alloyangia pacifica]SFT05089.1 hypothetical protein SAMN04488050_1099 [Alloyangia pacifica]
MTRRLVNLGSGFWNIRCTMKVAGIVNIGTQVSIVRLRSGRFVFLDSYALNGEIRELVMGLTQDGSLVEAVLNLHPFHTLHCAAMARDFPDAKFYGSERHRRVCASVPWEAENVESPSVAEKYSRDLEFSLPAGIQYFSENEKVHAGSLLAFHPASGSLHVDDTLNVLPVPGALRGYVPRLVLHPTLGAAMKAEEGSNEKFCRWLEDIGARWCGTKSVCAAHNGVARFAEGDFEQVMRGLAARTRKRPAA